MVCYIINCSASCFYSNILFLGRAGKQPSRTWKKEKWFAKHRTGGNMWAALSLFDGSILIQSYTLYYCSVDVHRLCCVYIRRKENKKKGGGKSGVYKTRYDPSTAALYQTALLAPLWRERSCCWHLVTFTTPWLPSCIWIFHQCMHKISLFFIPPLFFLLFLRVQNICSWRAWFFLSIFERTIPCRSVWACPLFKKGTAMINIRMDLSCTPRHFYVITLDKIVWLTFSLFFFLLLLLLFIFFFRVTCWTVFKKRDIFNDSSESINNRVELCVPFSLWIFQTLFAFSKKCFPFLFVCWL